jgi:hypothetical protein
MSSYKARYQGSNEEVLSEGASPRMAAKTFVEKVGYKPIPVEVWNDRWIIFDSHIDEQRAYQMEAEEKERASYQMQAEEKAILEKLIKLTQRIKSEGFKVLTASEIQAIGDVLDEVLTSNTESEEKLDLAKVTLMDEQAYKFYTLRSNTRSSLQQQAMLKAMNVNLSDISQKTSGVKMASMFTGMAAARHLGEEIAEDFGGED